MTQTARRRAPKRRKKIAARGFFNLIKLAIAITAVVLIVVNVIQFTSKDNVFLDNVYVNGLSLGGYSYEDGYNLVWEQAQQRLSGNPITLSYGEKTWSLTPAMLDASMDIDSQLALAWNFGHTGNFFQKRSQRQYLANNMVAFNSELNYDEEKLDAFISEIKSEIDVAPVDATVIIKSDEQLDVTESSSGLELSADAVKEALTKVIVEGSAPSIDLVPQVVEPTITAAELKNGTQLIATCTTSVKGSTKNRVNNVAQALKRFNGFVVHPDETISFNKVVGKRTAENGFKEAAEFAGTTVQQGIGGGVCQASTTLYNALLRAGMTVETRYQHTMTVGYIKPSLDATVTDSGKDLVFTNNRDSSIYIYTSVEDGEAHVRIYGQPTEYKIVLESVTIQDNIEATPKKKKDKTGKYAYYTDEMVLASEGKTGIKSQAFICYYDRNTGELVERDELQADYYAPSAAVYWVGVNEREEE